MPVLRQQTLNLVLVRNAALGLSPDPASTKKGVPKYSDQEKMEKLFQKDRNYLTMTSRSHERIYTLFSFKENKTHLLNLAE